MIAKANSLYIPLKNESVNCVVTSPPYWGLRKYDIPGLVWDGNEGCGHEWGNARKIPATTHWNTGGVFDPNNRKVVQEKSEVGQFCLLCNAWRGQLGLEPTIDLYLKHLLQCFDEVWRVLKPTGTLWVNLGDSYSGSNCGSNDYRAMAGGNPKYTHFAEIYKGQKPGKINNIPSKSLCLIPERFAIGMVNRGWILRNKIIWHKPNCMPASVKDRFTVDFEPVFFFVKSNDTQYWTNEKTMRLVDKQPLGTRGIEEEDWEWREVPVQIGETNRKQDNVPSKNANTYIGFNDRYQGRSKTIRKKVSLWTGNDYFFEQQYENYDKPLDRWGGDSKKLTDNLKGDEYLSAHRERDMRPNPQGRNRRCVWTIPTQPYPESHFATFPEALIEPMIKAGCPKEICVKCGKGRKKIYKKSVSFQSGSGKAGNPPKGKWEGKEQEISGDYDIRMGPVIDREEIGLTDCGCNAGSRPGIVLDPFAGSGTVQKVAERLGRRAIGLDLGYHDLQKKRTQGNQVVLPIMEG